MHCSEETMRLYAVTDRAWTGKQTLYQQVEAALKGGVTCVQLREKDLDPVHFLEEARQLCTLCHSYQVPFIINDNVEIAIACGADGVHVGQADMAAGDVRRRVGESMLLGVSCHTVQQALLAEQNGADYLGVGAMFSTSTKTDASVLPLSVLQEICSAVRIPVVAIGGIHRENIGRLSGTGIAGVALVSAIFAAADIEHACRELKTLSQAVAGA